MQYLTTKSAAAFSTGFDAIPKVSVVANRYVFSLVHSSLTHFNAEFLQVGSLAHLTSLKIAYYALSCILCGLKA